MNKNLLYKILSLMLCAVMVCVVSFAFVSCTSDAEKKEGSGDASGDAIEYETVAGDASGDAEMTEETVTGDASGDAQ